MIIHVCGPGCANCRKTEKLIQEVVDELDMKAQIIKVTDFQDIAKYGILSTPAVVINGVVKCVGKVPTKNEITSWLV